MVMKLNMQLTHKDDTKLSGLNHLNVLVGRNGSGKSRLLRKWYQHLRNLSEFSVLYVSPERTGIFKQDAGVEQGDSSRSDYEFDQRNRNQAGSFKELSFLKLKRLKELFSDRVLSDFELRSDFSRDFDTEYLNDLNALLSNVSIRFTLGKLSITNMNGIEIAPDQISSGEAEAVSLASEVMAHLAVLESESTNIVLIDEPEAHMHPDLQVRFLNFIVKRWALLEDQIQERTYLLLATHSTSLLGAAMERDIATIGVKKFADDNVAFSKAHDAIKDSVPFFAHPLSSVFNLEIPLVVEGEDDERIWQQVSRRKGGDFNFFPCLSTSVDVQKRLERFLEEKLPAFYDDPQAVSIRDGDGKADAMSHFAVVKRYRLKCYAAENLLLSDEGLAALDFTWCQFQKRAKEWATNEGKSHRDKDLILEISNSDDRNRHKKIKKVRNLIPAICGSSIPWEAAVGRAIADINVASDDRNSIYQYLGPELCLALNLIKSEIEVQ